MKKIIIAGGTGFLGSALTTHFISQGYQVIILTRNHKPNKGNLSYVKWDGKNLGPWANALENAEAVINLNGKSVNCRYTKENKEKIYDTRISATHVLGQAIYLCQHRPKLWINAASATIYPHSLTDPMTEDFTDFANDFSVDVCKKWETAFNENEIPGVRKVILRIAIVLGKGSNSALTPLKNLVRAGLGGHQGKGNQMFSWIHEKDFVSIVDYCLLQQEVKGVYNVAAPKPITNRKLMSTLRKALKAPFGLPSPEFLLKIGGHMIGTEAELIVKSRYVIPQKIQKAGYHFEYPEIQSALDDLC